MSPRFDNSTIRHEEPLSLRVFFPSGPATFSVRHGLSIGSDSSCDIFVDHIDVEPHHARVMRNGGGWTLEGMFANQVYLLDGSSFRELGLMRGTTFRVGPVIVQCMATSDADDDANIPEASAVGSECGTAALGCDLLGNVSAVAAKPAELGVAEAAMSLASVPLHCGRCNGLVAHLPIGAKFCPRCGQALPERPAALVGADSGARSRHPLLDLLVPLLDATLPATLRQRMSGLDPSRPATLLAYLNTLVRLGMRYESGDGTGKNVSQALRYYTKAAKLGSEPAKLRLAAGDLPRATAATEPSVIEES